MSPYFRFATVVSAISGALIFANGAEDHGYNQWYYGIDGEENWPGQCRGDRQSPINIMTKKVSKVKPMREDSQLVFTNYDNSIDTTVHNNGHTVKIVIPKSAKVTVEGGILRSTYRLKEIHFHWESEHTINYKRYPLEVHFVHIKDNIGSIEEAHEEDDLLVLGAIFNYEMEENPDISNATTVIRDVSKVDSSENITVVPLSLLPSTASYFSYNGSLTVPPCSEVVTWIVFEEPIPISRTQWNAYKKLETLNSTNSINYRRAMSIGSRSIMLVLPQTKYHTSNTSRDLPAHHKTPINLQIMTATVVTTLSSLFSSIIL